MVREPSTRPKVETDEVDVSRNCVGSVWDMSRWRRTRLTCLLEQSSHYSRAATVGRRRDAVETEQGRGRGSGRLAALVCTRPRRTRGRLGGRGGIRRGARRGAREDPRAAHVGL